MTVAEMRAALGVGPEVTDAEVVQLYVESLGGSDQADELAPIAYGTDDGFSAWLAAQGYALAVSAPAPAILRARGSAYVDGYEAMWTGFRTGGVMQELAWPRTNASLNCVLAIPADAIPPAVVAASYRAAWLEAQTPGVLNGTTSANGRRVKRQRVEGAVEREFFDDGKAQVGGGPAFIDSIIDGQLRQFICDSNGSAFMWSLGS